MNYNMSVITYKNELRSAFWMHVQLRKKLSDFLFYRRWEIELTKQKGVFKKKKLFMLILSVLKIVKVSKTVCFQYNFIFWNLHSRSWNRKNIKIIRDTVPQTHYENQRTEKITNKEALERMDEKESLRKSIVKRRV